VVSPGDENSDEYIRDYQDKRDQYAAIGIPEYWLVDPDRAWVMVGILVSSAYQFVTFRGNDSIVSPTFPELKLTAVQVLDAGRS
jgi:Uma2 family endonuclease